MKRLLSILAVTATIAMLSRTANALLVSKNCGTLNKTKSVHSTNSQSGNGAVFAPIDGSRG